MTGPVLHRGKLAEHPRVLSVRPLEREDFARIKQGAGRVVPRVKQFRDTHHRLARLVAGGMRTEQILRITGYSYTRFNTLRQDPAFQQLVAEYRGKVDEAWVDSVTEVHETAGALIIRGLRQIEDHFDVADDEGTLIPLKSLSSVTGDLMDRFGFSKKTVNTNVNVDIAKNLERLMALKGRSAVIDAKALTSPTLVPSPQAPTSPPEPEGAKPAVAKAGLRRWG